MRRTKILNAEEVRRKPFNEAKYEFLKRRIICVDEAADLGVVITAL